MSLAVYVGINKFKAESNADVREQSAIEITLSDIAKGQPHTDKTSNAENQFLVIDTLNEEALASLKNWLKKDTKNECVIAWPQPDAWLAASLANGVAGEEALNDWLAQAKRLLALFRTARRQVTLVGYLPGCELKAVKAPLLGRCDNAIYQLAAAYMSSQSQSLRDTLAYLVASSQECPVEENGETEVTQAALGEYHARQAESEQGRRTGRALQEADASQERQQQHIARLKGELSRARDEHTLLLQQLQNIQQVVAERTNELQVQREIAKQDEERLQEREQQLQVLKQENEALEQARDAQREKQDVAQQNAQSLKQENKALKQAFDSQQKEKQDEHTLLLQQLQNAQQVVTERTNELQVQGEIAKQDEERLQEREQQLQVLKQEHEALKQAFDSQQKEKQDEHALLLQQLQNTQQVVAERTNELQVQREIAKQGEERLQEREQQLQVLKQENEALNQAFDSQQKEKQDEERLQEREQQLQVLKQENEALNQAFDSQQKEKEASQQALNTVQNESAQLLSTLQQTQQAYESLYIEQQTLPEQLSTNQQELVKSASDQAYLRQQLEKHQSELNTLRTESEQRIHRLERLVQWLRVHAQRHAIAAYRSSRGYKKALPKQIAALEASSLFDADWYCAQYPDVAQANIQPAEHFIKFGAIDGRHPGPLFSTEFYLTHYEDVAASGQHPLLHYLHYGKEENREIHPPHYQLSALQTIAKGANA
ncbi:hypothetical protein ACQKE4_07975 [Halomonas sp. NPDC076908]|uniref:hypothetical protein n=1 Tax=Halomonas sp. NPDC076908 TaxID=3390567 RepID=UPI003D065BB4